MLPPERPEEMPHRAPPSWPSQGAVSFNHLALRYRDGLDLVLHDLSCDIRPGEKVGRWVLSQVIETSL